MQILFETILFCSAIIAPALLASSFKSNSAHHIEKTAEASHAGYRFADMSPSRWLSRRKRTVTI